MPYADVDLVAQIAGSSMRWRLSESSAIEVWRGTQLLGRFSGETLRQIVAQHLSLMALVATMQAALDADEPEPPRSRPVVLRLPSAPQSPLDPERQAARRQQRRSRRKPR